MKTSPRSVRAGIVIQRILPTIFRTVLPNSSSMITIIHTEVSGDMGVVDIIISIIGKDEAEILTALLDHRKIIGRSIAQKLSFRRVPTVRIKKAHDISFS